MKNLSKKTQFRNDGLERSMNHKGCQLRMKSNPVCATALNICEYYTVFVEKTDYPAWSTARTSSGLSLILKE